MDFLKKIGHFFQHVATDIDHAIVFTLRLLGSIFTGTELRTAMSYVVKAGEMYVENAAAGLVSQVVNPQRREWVTGELMLLPGMTESRARILTETAVQLVKNKTHDLIAAIDAHIEGHVATDETAAGLSDPAPVTTSAQETATTATDPTPVVPISDQMKASGFSGARKTV